MKAKVLPVLHIEDFEDSPRPHPDVYVELFREHVAQYPFVNRPHRHDFYLLMLFVQGKGTHTIDFIDYSIQPGIVFFMAPSQVHTWTYSDDTEGYLFFFNTAFLSDFPTRRLADVPLFQSLTTRPVVPIPTESVDDIQDLFLRVYKETINSSYHRDDIIRSYLNILLVKLSGFLLTNQSAPLSLHTRSQIQQLESLIEKHYLDHKTVGDYARMMAVSEKQLYTVCRTALGKSPRKIIEQRVVLEAKRLLIHADLSVAQVADRLNFLNHSYFNRFFRKATGETPNGFRRKCQ